MESHFNISVRIMIRTVTGKKSFKGQRHLREHTFLKSIPITGDSHCATRRRGRLARGARSGPRVCIQFRFPPTGRSQRQPWIVPGMSCFLGGGGGGLTNKKNGTNSPAVCRFSLINGENLLRINNRGLISSDRGCRGGVVCAAH